MLKELQGGAEFQNWLSEREDQVVDNTEQQNGEDDTEKWVSEDLGLVKQVKSKDSRTTPVPTSLV